MGHSLVKFGFRAKEEKVDGKMSPCHVSLSREKYKLSLQEYSNASETEANEMVPLYIDLPYPVSCKAVVIIYDWERLGGYSGGGTKYDILQDEGYDNDLQLWSFSSTSNTSDVKITIFTTVLIKSV